MSQLTFFSEVDKTKDGRISSEYPAWMMETHKEYLEEGIRQKEAAVKFGIENPERRREFIAELEKEKKKLYLIEKARPKISDSMKDKIAKEYFKIRAFIADSMFSKVEMHEGLADAHEEARRMSKPCIEVDKDIAEACNVKMIEDCGKVSRNQATKIFRILGAYLGEITNVEYLRPDRRKDI